MKRIFELTATIDSKSILRVGNPTTAILYGGFLFLGERILNPASLCSLPGF